MLNLLIARIAQLFTVVVVFRGAEGVAFAHSFERGAKGTKHANRCFASSKAIPKSVVSLIKSAHVFDIDCGDLNRDQLYAKVYTGDYLKTVRNQVTNAWADELNQAESKPLNATQVAPDARSYPEIVAALSELDRDTCAAVYAAMRANWIGGNGGKAESYKDGAAARERIAMQVLTQGANLAEIVADHEEPTLLLTDRVDGSDKVNAAIAANAESIQMMQALLTQVLEHVTS